MLDPRAPVGGRPAARRLPHVSTMQAHTMTPHRVREDLMPDYRQCPHGFHHPPHAHSCDGCWCEGERDRREYGWPHDTTPQEADHG